MRIANMKIPLENFRFKSDAEYKKAVSDFFEWEGEKNTHLPNLLASASTSDEACRSILKYCDSYESLPALLNHHSSMDRALWLQVLGEMWSMFDNVWEYKERLLSIFQNLTRKELNLMMLDDELVEFNKLPEKIIIYRGCYEINRHGISWSTSQNIAKEFTTFARYRIDGETPLLMMAKIPKSHAVLKLDRGEFEVIVTDLSRLEYQSL